VDACYNEAGDDVRSTSAAGNENRYLLLEVLVLLGSMLLQTLVLGLLVLL